MIHLICTFEPARIHFLPQFIDHYRQLGVEVFHLSLQVEPDVEPEEKARASHGAQETLLSRGLSLLAVLNCPFSAMALREHHNQIQLQSCQITDWIVWVDIDEFQIYPGSFQDSLRFAEENNLDYFWGRFVDRVTADGSLQPFDPDRPIWEQYPIETHITRDVAKAQTQKLTCARGNVQVTSGNHSAANPETLRYFGPPVAIHHFKWDDSVLQRLRRRVMPDWRERWPWWVESRNLLEFLQSRPKQQT